MISYVNLSKRPYLLLFTVALAALLVAIYPLLFGSDVHHASANGGDEGKPLPLWVVALGVYRSLYRRGGVPIDGCLPPRF